MKILRAYIRMLGAQIGKLPVSVGNGSDRTGTSTLTSYTDGLSRSGNPDYWWKVVDIVWHELVCYPLHFPTITF